MKREQIECSETSAHNIQMPGNHPKERIQQEFYSSLEKVCDIVTNCNMTTTIEDFSTKVGKRVLFIYCIWKVKP